MSGDLTTLGGFVDGNYIQLAKQLLGVVVVSSYSFGLTFLLVKVFDYIPGLKLRVNDEEESMGCDITLCGEVGYDYTNTSVAYEEDEELKA